MLAQPPAKIVWFHGEKELPLNEDFIQKFDALTQTATLTIQKAYADDHGVYRALAFNQHGIDETTSFLEVEDLEERKVESVAPVVLEPLSPKLATLGASVDLKVHYKSYPPSNVRWYRDKKEIQVSENHLIFEFEDETILSINELKQEDQAEYHVRIFNDVGEARSSATVKITREFTYLPYFARKGSRRPGRVFNDSRKPYYSPDIFRGPRVS